VKWSPELDVFCSVDGKRKSYCTPEAYHGDTCWLFRNRGNGTFEDVTAKSGIFDPTSKSLGVTLVDYDRDGWPDILVANDTQPNKLYRNQRNGTFEDVAVHAGVAFSEDGKARAGMGIDAADFDNSGVEGIAITNFDNEMMALYRPSKPGMYADVAMGAASARRRATVSASAARSSISISTGGSIWSRSTATSTRPSGRFTATPAMRSRRTCF
jgi:enediyne biosynthesis protein E4